MIGRYCNRKIEEDILVSPKTPIDKYAFVHQFWLLLLSEE